MNEPLPGCVKGHHMPTCGTPGCGGCQPKPGITSSDVIRVAEVEHLVKEAQERLGEAQQIAYRIKNDYLRECCRLKIQEIEAPQWKG